MPIGRLLKGVACSQDQQFVHIPTDKLEPNREPIASLAAGQGQRRVAAHVKRRSEPDPCLYDRRRATSGHDVGQAPYATVHSRHDKQVDFAKERIEPTTKHLPAKLDFGHSQAIEATAGFQQAGEYRTVFGSACWISRLMFNRRLRTAKKQCIAHNFIGRGKVDVAQQSAHLRQHRCRFLSHTYHFGVGASCDQRTIDSDAQSAHSLPNARKVIRHRFLSSCRIVRVGASDHAQQSGGIGGAARHWSDMIHRLGKCEHAGPTDQTPDSALVQ